MIFRKFKYIWSFFWMQFAGLSFRGRIATRLASWVAPPYYGRCYLAQLNQKGYIAPTATVHHGNLSLGKNVFIGDRVVIFQDREGGPVEINEGACLYGETFIQTGYGGSLRIGKNSHIHPRCQISAYKSCIHIGCGVQIAPNCAFYPYDHGIEPDQSIEKQPLVTKGGIIIGDDAWLGFGVIVLDGVKIGKGAVVGAGSVVTHDVPDGAIAIGVPARVTKMRSDLNRNKTITTKENLNESVHNTG